MSRKRVSCGVREWWCLAAEVGRIEGKGEKVALDDVEGEGELRGV